MAHYHCKINSRGKGYGADHAQYIERGGRFSAEQYGEIGESERGNLPEWAQGSAARFFAEADERERANGSTYREFELALPRELTDAQRGDLVRAFVAQEIGDRHAYVWAIHEPQGENPHVHIMFSERTRDGIERGEERYFKRANTQQPERGGCLKSDRFSGGKTKAERLAAVEDLRGRWALAQNQALDRAGLDVRVDHRSLCDQGIEREPGQHRGPAVSGIEARGQIAQVTARREQQRQIRRAALEPERLGLVAEIQDVSREEVAAARVAVKERRELAQDVAGPARDEVLKSIEADRREQLERVGARCERRVERRGSLGGSLGGRLLDQARALRGRIGQQLQRVREWVLERFPAPRMTLDLEAVKARGRAASDRWRRDLQHRELMKKEAALEQHKHEQVVKEFADLASSRALGQHGYGDRSEKWRATPQALRDRIDQFNALTPAKQKQELARLARDSARVREIQQEIEQRRAQVRQLDRGLGR